MWLTDELKPSHQAISRFINEHLQVSIKDIFIHLNKYIIEREQIDINKVFIDGTKIESVANKYTFVWRGSIEKFELKLHLKVTKLIKQMNKEYEYLNVSFSEHERYEVSYLERIKLFLDNLVISNDVEFVYGSGKRKTMIQRHIEAIEECIDKLKEYQMHLNIMGKNRNSYSRKDHDATFMRLKEDHMRNEQLKPAYNLQIGVSDEYIINLMISQDRNDMNTFIPFLESFKNEYNYYPKYPVADSGYGSFNNYK